MVAKSTTIHVKYVRVRTSKIRPIIVGMLKAAAQMPKS